jgi:hypothetical protein
MTEARNTFTNADIDPWMFHMRRGDFAAAWKICDDVLRARRGKPCCHLPRHQQYVWDGTPLDGRRVLVRCYHGLGDTVQYIRFARLVKAVAQEVIVWAQPALRPLLRTVDGIDRLLPLHDGTLDVDYDVDVESMELAHVFRITPETLPSEVPYIDVGSAMADCPRGDFKAPFTLTRRNTNPLAGNIERAAAGPITGGRGQKRLYPNSADLDGSSAHHMQKEVGIVWSSGIHDETRSVPFHYLEPLMKLRNVRLHILQRGPAYHAWPPELGVHDGSDDIQETARRMRSLDLVISVDSFPAHLAGALGVPVWTLLQHQADWRWMTNREDSPWYPTMRLFRQPAPGDWRCVVEQVRRALEALIAEEE